MGEDRHVEEEKVKDCCDRASRAIRIDHLLKLTVLFFHLHTSSGSVFELRKAMRFTDSWPIYKNEFSGVNKNETFRIKKFSNYYRIYAIASERSRRFSDSKFGLECDVAGRSRHVALDSLEKQLHRLAAQLARRLRHHGEAGGEFFRPCEIVVSDDSDGLRAGDAGFVSSSTEKSPLCIA